MQDGLSVCHPFPRNRGESDVVKLIIEKLPRLVCHFIVAPEESEKCDFCFTWYSEGNMNGTVADDVELLFRKPGAYGIITVNELRCKPN